MSNTSRLSICSQGLVNDNQHFMLVGVVKDGMSTAFKNFTNIDNPQDKVFILCGSKLEHNQKQSLLYFSNDPNDFIYNKNLLGGYGVIPFSKEDDTLYIDIPDLHNTHTRGLPSSAKFSNNSNNELNSVTFTNITCDQVSTPNRLYYGLPYKLTFDNNQRMDFYIRRNQNLGRIGPSIAWFSQSSSIFEYQKTDFFGAHGNGTSFVFDADNNNYFGVSKLTLDTNSVNFSDLPTSNSTGVIKIEQGTSTWFNVIDNTWGLSSHTSLEIDEGSDFLNTQVYDPDNSKGISIQINLRNREDNFVSIPNITPTTNEVFDYYFVTLGGFTSGGFENNSNQYFNSTNITGGLCYYSSEELTYYTWATEENKKGLINSINCLNNTAILKTTTDTSKVTDRHAEPETAFSTQHDASLAIDLNSSINCSQSSTCGKNISAGNEQNKPCILKNNANELLADPNSKIFSDNPQNQEVTYLIEIIVMAVLLVAYLIFAFYYNSMTLNQK